MAGTMRRVVAGSKSEGERSRRRAAREETAETLQARGIPLGGFDGAGSVRSAMSPGLQRRLEEAEEAEAREQTKLERQRAVRAEQSVTRRRAGGRSLPPPPD